jgi:hypothetical protein
VGRLFLSQRQSFHEILFPKGQDLLGYGLISPAAMAMTPGARPAMGKTSKSPDLIVTAFAGALAEGAAHCQTEESKEANPNGSK